MVEPAKLLDEAKELAEIMASKPPLGIRAAKEAIDGGLNMSLAEGLAWEAHLWSALCGTEDQKEGMQAFVEKRPPEWKGS